MNCFMPCVHKNIKPYIAVSVYSGCDDLYPVNTQRRVLFGLLLMSFVVDVFLGGGGGGSGSTDYVVLYLLLNYNIIMVSACSNITLIQLQERKMPSPP